VTTLHASPFEASEEVLLRAHEEEASAYYILLSSPNLLLLEKLLLSTTTSKAIKFGLISESSMLLASSLAHHSIVSVYWNLNYWLIRIVCIEPKQFVKNYGCFS
jgi:hypothetical protein